MQKQERAEMIPESRADSTTAKLAEEVGFEPTVPVTRDGGFQDRCLKPLDHSSGWKTIQPEEREMNFESPTA